MKPIKLLIVSPCQGAYGGIEAFALAVATAVRKEPDFEVRVCFKKTKHFARQQSLKTMLAGEPGVEFCERADRDLAGAIRWADIVHLQNASPDVVALARLVPEAARAYEPQLHTARLCFSTSDKNFGF